MIIFFGYYHSDVALKRLGVSAFLFVSIAEPPSSVRMVNLGHPPVGTAEEQTSDQHVCPRACHQREKRTCLQFF